MFSAGDTRIQLVGGNFDITTNSAYVKFSNDAGTTERMRIGNGLDVGGGVDPGGKVVNVGSGGGYRIGNTAPSGHVLIGNGTSYVDGIVGSGTPGGSDTQVQYNNAGAFGGISAFTWNGSLLKNTAQNEQAQVRTITSGASAVLDDINVSAHTTTVTGSTQITTAKGFNKVSLYKPTYTDLSAVTVDQGATLYIEDAPNVAGSLTLTNPYALWIDNGTLRIDGKLSLGTSFGTSGQPLLSGGSGSNPTFGTLGVAGGGTGLTTLTVHDLYVGNGASAPNAVATGSSGQVLTSNGASSRSHVPNQFAFQSHRHSERDYHRCRH
jgi:hypothetical protein